MGQIDRMIGNLNREQAADDYKKDWCNEERNTARSTEARHEFDHGNLGAKIGHLEDHKSQTETGINETNQNMEDLHTALEEALANRNAEEAASKKAQLDDMNAIKLLASAIERLGSFSANHPAFLQSLEESATARHHNASKTPPGTWSGSYGGRSSESTGVLSLLGGIKDKFGSDLEEEKETEKKALDAYWKMRKGTELQIKSLEEGLDTLDGELAKTIREIATKTKERTDTNLSWTATTDYLEELKPECDWVESEEDDGYEPRHRARNLEIKDLQNSKLVLAGAAVPELMAVKSKVTKAPMTVAQELQAVNPARSAFLRRA
jgi:chromosome segregation ATPase